MILLPHKKQRKEDRSKPSASCLPACLSLYTTVSIASSSRAISLYSLVRSISSFFSRRARHLPHYQAGVAAENARLPTVGGSLRAQASHSHSVARPRHEEERPQAGRVRPPLPPGHGTSQTLWRLLHLQNYGTGP